MRAREMVNKILWHPMYDQSYYTIVYLHRGAPKNERSVPFDKIVSFQKSDFVIIRPDGMESYIPYHRILRIVSSDATIVWKKREAI